MISLVKGVLMYIENLGANKKHLMQCVNYMRYVGSKPSHIVRYSPITLSVAATDRCNFKCGMCQTHSGIIGDFPFKHKPSKDVDFALFKKFVDKFRGALNLAIVGTGEPMLNKDFFKMVEYGKKVMRMRVRTSSNGTFDEPKAEQMLSSGLDIITISLNGHNADEFDRMTNMGKDTFEIILNKIKFLVKKRSLSKSKLDIACSFVIDQKNYVHIPDMIKLSDDLGVDGAEFYNFLPAPFRGFTAEERCLTSDNISAVKFLSGIDLSKYRCRVCLPRIIDSSGQWNMCPASFTTIRIDGDGNIGGCPIMLLNLENNGKFEDKNVWNNEYFQKLRKSFLNKNEDNRCPPCKSCCGSCGIEIRACGV